MDLATLQRTIAAAQSGGTFDLAGAALGDDSAPVPTLFTALFQQPRLTLRAASVDTSGGQTVVRGALASTPRSAYGFLAGMGAVATFSLDSAGTPQLHLTLTPASPAYGLPDALPKLKNSLFAAFAWGGAQFGFDTANPAVLPASFPSSYDYPANSSALQSALWKGMKFQAQVTYRGSDSGLQWLLGSGPLAVSGPLEWDGAKPRFDLASAPLGVRAVGPFSLPLSLHLLGLLLEVPPREGAPAQVFPTAFAVLEGTLGLPNASPNLAIPFYLRMFSEPLGQVTVVGNFTQASQLALSEVAALLGVSSLESQQPASGFPALAGLALQTVALTVETSNGQLVMASATLAYTPPGGVWAPFGSDLFTFAGLAVTFYVMEPLALPSFATVIAATLGLASGTLEAEISLPSLDFSGALAENGPPIDLTALMAKITGGAFGDSFKILCTQLKVLGNPSQNYYRFQAAVSGANTWGFDALGARFQLNSVAFDLTFQTGAGGQITGQVVAQLMVAGAVAQISSDYLGAGTGWKFAGGTQGPQDISLTHLVNDALTLFGLSLPATAPQVLITKLEMMLVTQNMDFGFSCDGRVEMMGVTVDMGVDLGRTHDDPQDPSNVTITFAGYLSIGGQTFTANFAAGAANKTIKFEWQDTGEPLGFAAIASFFGYSLPELPENLDLGLQNAKLYYDFNAGTLIVSARSVNYGQLLFASLTPTSGPNAGKRVYLFTLDVPLNLELSSLPVIGHQIPPNARFGIQDLQVIAASAALSTADVSALNTLITTSLSDLALTPTTLGQGFTFAADLQLDSTVQPIILPLTGRGTQPALTADVALPAKFAAPAPGAAPTYQAGAKWFNIEKSFGPAQFQRIGVQYQNNKLFFLLDATVSFSALRFAFDGLGIGSPLTRFQPVGHLDGIDVAFSSGPVTINGGLLNVPASALPPEVAYEYTGAMVIAVQPWLIAGVASYAKVAQASSFFLFAQARGAFGGPPAFFITGFMGGFGYNSRLALPRPEQVYQFPFLVDLDDPAIFGANPTPMGVLNVLSGAGGAPAWVTPTVGENWLAAGISFRSFELVIGRALLVAEFGQEFEVALLGVASVSLPQGATTDAYAYVELQLEAVFKPDEGFFGLSASLTPASFVLMKDCHLTGGFAFYLWFGPNPHAGDFVVTVGGYHPAFVVPAWYPVPARVGFNWQVSKDVTIKGGSYFALTPAAVMAGGSLEVLFQAGSVKAWFIAYTNLLIAWKPFHFNASIGISLGASVRINLLFTTVTLSFELGATLDLWGPPTGGTVHVHLYILSFSVPFGSTADSATPPPLDWNGFQALLPQASAPTPAPAALLRAGAEPTAQVLGVKVNRGLARQDEAGVWYVRADELIFTSETAVPATAFAFAGGTPPLAADAAPVALPASISIRPMNLAAATSIHTVAITSIDDGTQLDLSPWTRAPQSRNLPAALWGAPLAGGALPAPLPAPNAATIPGLPSGVQLYAPPAIAGASPGAVNIARLVAPLGGGYQPLRPGAQADPIPAPVSDATIITTIMNTLASPAAQTAQNGLIAALTGLQAAPPTHAPLAKLAQQAGESFSQAPLRAA